MTEESRKRLNELLELEKKQELTSDEKAHKIRLIEDLEYEKQVKSRESAAEGYKSDEIEKAEDDIEKQIQELDENEKNKKTLEYKFKKHKK